jgi:DNA-binding GntR family transcriptional regulator
MNGGAHYYAYPVSRSARPCWQHGRNPTDMEPGDAWHLAHWYTRTVTRLSAVRKSGASGLAPLPRTTTTSDLVVGAIRGAILAGRLGPGETLVERRLAEQLGVSKTPVREAIITLAASGLVTITPNRGAVVRAVSAADVSKAYEVRLLLEPWAVGRTVRHGVPQAIGAAEAALERARPHLAGGNDHVQLSLANRDFHRALYASCGNDIVVTQLDGLQELAALGAVAMLWDHWPTWREEYTEHEEILAAARDGAAELAERLLRRHIRQSVRRLEQRRAMLS